MKIGICGFSGSGKSTVFQWLTGDAPDLARAQHGQVGNPAVPDARLVFLSSLFNPKKTTATRMELLDTPGLHPTERRDNPRRLAIMRDAGGLMVILNGYAGGSLTDELRRFREELLFADLEIVTNRIDKLKDLAKKTKPTKQREAEEAESALLTRVAGCLEKGEGAHAAHLRPDEEKTIRSFQLLTLKPELVFVNIGDDRIGKPLPDELLKVAPTALQSPAKLELELAELSEDDRKVFMQDLNLTGFSKDETLQKIFYAMNQIVFFTVGEDECRAWAVPKGSTAPQGAGQIHSDLEHGFVRAEVVHFDDFKKHGSMKEAKHHGVYHLEGKTYIVRDGDIMHILHS
ncbi:MAG: redox-regulated ATPase YchF [Planctomycetes bacterium]|nr:redox-regulated ATPase YchF [Planctomycetota bacterium]